MQHKLTLAIGCLLALPVLGQAEEAAPKFGRHVQAIFGRLGCSGGTCHGAVNGQNGFRLSLFGADVARDYAHLLRDEGGRRLNRVDPASSLLLLKATGQVAHYGGQRMAVGSPEYDLLRRWIAGGATLDAVESSNVRALKVTPLDRTARRGESYPLQVEAQFADGSTEDVTVLCSFESFDPRIASVDANGRVKAGGVGDTAIIVRYRATPTLAQILVPREGNEPFPETQANNFVDGHVLAKLRRLNLPPAPLADDAAFLRRACLDVTGELPTAKEVRDFLADSTADKRVRKIDELLTRPGHAALWTLRFCDLLKAHDWGGFGFQIATEKDAPRFQAWVRGRLEENLPYDQFVERILTATSREGRSLEEYAAEVLAVEEGHTAARKDLEIYKARQTLDLYWQRNGASGVGGTLQVAHAFLGLRLECAQCHRHPSDVWQQDDLLSFANFFMRVRPVGGNYDLLIKKNPETAALCKTYQAEGKKLGEQVKQMREAEGKKLDVEVKQARTDIEKLGRDLAKLEADAKQLIDMAVKKPAEADALNAKAAILKEQAAELRTKIDSLKPAITRYEEFQKEVARLERRSKSMGALTSRLVHHELHLMTKEVPFASVTSPLGTQTSKQFRLLGQTEPVEVPADGDPRTIVMAWMRRPDNPYFARAIVNRVWAHYYGRGIIDPPDNLAQFNPATHPELLKELADGFVQNNFDLRWLHRTILTSRTYQQSSKATAANELDRTNYAYSYYRRLPAEVLLDALNQATGTTEKMGMEQFHWPADLKTVELPHPPKNPSGPDGPTNGFVAFMLDNFGKPKRNSAVQCDCERDPSATMLQVLSLANHPRVWAKVEDPTGRTARIAKDITDDGQRIEEVYLAVLNRLPTDAERQVCRDYLKGSKTPAEGMQGILWSLVNTREFLLQH